LAILDYATLADPVSGAVDEWPIDDQGAAIVPAMQFITARVAWFESAQLAKRKLAWPVHDMLRMKDDRVVPRLGPPDDAGLPV